MDEVQFIHLFKNSDIADVFNCDKQGQKKKLILVLFEQQ
jgi:hypothetical protein